MTIRLHVELAARDVGSMVAGLLLLASGAGALVHTGNPVFINEFSAGGCRRPLDLARAGRTPPGARR
jgi:hypothetical protein